MRRSKTERIDSLIEAAFQQMGLGTRMKEMRVINSWDQIIGGKIAKSTTHINIYNRTLFLTMNSAAVKNELSMLKTAIVAAVNRFAEKEIIDEVVIR